MQFEDCEKNRRATLSVMQNFDLSTFEGLQHNWDGYDALAPELETIENFRQVVEGLNWPAFDIYASTNGCMDIESDTQSGVTFHLQVGVSRYSMYVLLGGDKRVKYYLMGDFDKQPFPYDEVQIALDTLIKS